MGSQNKQVAQGPSTEEIEEQSKIQIHVRETSIIYNNWKRHDNHE